MVDLRALLKRLEWSGLDPWPNKGSPICPCCQNAELLNDERRGHAPDCELAAALAEFEKLLVAVERDGTTQEYRGAEAWRKFVEVFGTPNTLPAPHVKVTELSGRLSVDGMVLRPSSIGDGFSVGGCLPEAAWQMGVQDHLVDGPRGRFRVTVEFWPEEG